MHDRLHAFSDRTYDHFARYLRTSVRTRAQDKLLRFSLYEASCMNLLITEFFGSTEFFEKLSRTVARKFFFEKREKTSREVALPCLSFSSLRDECSVIICLTRSNAFGFTFRHRADMLSLYVLCDHACFQSLPFRREFSPPSRTDMRSARKVRRGNGKSCENYCKFSVDPI